MNKSTNSQHPPSSLLLANLNLLRQQNTATAALSSQTNKFINASENKHYLLPFGNSKPSLTDRPNTSTSTTPSFRQTNAPLTSQIGALTPKRSTQQTTEDVFKFSRFPTEQTTSSSSGYTAQQQQLQFSSRQMNASTFLAHEQQKQYEDERLSQSALQHHQNNYLSRSTTSIPTTNKSIEHTTTIDRSLETSLERTRGLNMGNSNSNSNSTNNNNNSNNPAKKKKFDNSLTATNQEILNKLKQLSTAAHQSNRAPTTAPLNPTFSTSSSIRTSTKPLTPTTNSNNANNSQFKSLLNSQSPIQQSSNYKRNTTPTAPPASKLVDTLAGRVASQHVASMATKTPPRTTTPPNNQYQSSKQPAKLLENYFSQQPRDMITTPTTSNQHEQQQLQQYMSSSRQSVPSLQDQLYNNRVAPQKQLKSPTNSKKQNIIIPTAPLIKNSASTSQIKSSQLTRVNTVQSINSNNDTPVIPSGASTPIELTSSQNSQNTKATFNPKATAQLHPAPTLQDESHQQAFNVPLILGTSEYQLPPQKQQQHHHHHSKNTTMNTNNISGGNNQQLHASHSSSDSSNYSEAHSVELNLPEGTTTHSQLHQQQQQTHPSRFLSTFSHLNKQESQDSQHAQQQQQIQQQKPLKKQQQLHLHTQLPKQQGQIRSQPLYTQQPQPESTGDLEATTTPRKTNKSMPLQSLQGNKPKENQNVVVESRERVHLPQQQYNNQQNELNSLESLEEPITSRCNISNNQIYMQNSSSSNNNNNNAEDIFNSQNVFPQQMIYNTADAIYKQQLASNATPFYRSDFIANDQSVQQQQQQFMLPQQQQHHTFNYIPPLSASSSSSQLFSTQQQQLLQPFTQQQQQQLFIQAQQQQQLFQQMQQFLQAQQMQQQQQLPQFQQPYQMYQQPQQQQNQLIQPLQPTQFVNMPQQQQQQQLQPQLFLQKPVQHLSQQQPFQQQQQLTAQQPSQVSQLAQIASVTSSSESIQPMISEEEIDRITNISIQIESCLFEMLQNREFQHQSVQLLQYQNLLSDLCVLQRLPVSKSFMKEIQRAINMQIVLMQIIVYEHIVVIKQLRESVRGSVSHNENLQNILNSFQFVHSSFILILIIFAQALPNETQAIHDLVAQRTRKRKMGFLIKNNDKIGTLKKFNDILQPLILIMIEGQIELVEEYQGPHSLYEDLYQIQENIPNLPIAQIIDFSLSLSSDYAMSEELGRLKILSERKAITKSLESEFIQADDSEPSNQQKESVIQNEENNNHETSQQQLVSTVSPPYLKDPPSKLYTLVLDLDETLVHYVELEEGGKFLVRPQADRFLEEMAQYYEIIIFTAALQDYADFILDIIDSKKSIAYRFYRQHTVQHENSYYKDLSRIGRDINKTIIIDNLAENFKFQPENGIQIQSWYGEADDKALLELTPLLKQIVVKNFRSVQAAFKQFREKTIENLQRGICDPHLNLSLEVEHEDYQDGM